MTQAARTAGPDVRTQILREATRLFAAQGFEATSLQEIADAVGVRKPSLLHHFASKDALRQSVLAEMLQHWSVVLPKVLLAATSSHGQFDGVLAETTLFFSEEPDRARLLLREALDRPREMRALIRQYVRPWTNVISEFIAKGQTHGRLWPEADPEAYVVVVIHLLVAVLATRDLLKTLPPERLGAELLRVAKTALFKPADWVAQEAAADSRNQPDPSQGA